MAKNFNPNSVRRRKIYLTFLTAISLVYIGWRLFYTVPLQFGWVSAVFGIALLVAEITAILEAFIHFTNMVAASVPEMPEISPEMYPDVDILIATHNEDAELLYKTVNGCLFLDYPDRNKVHIYLCDDSDRPAIKKLADKLGVGYFGLANNKFAKAGNLNNALAKTSSPLVATLDADMIPTSRFLMESVPYFFLPDMIKENGVWRRREGDELKNKKKIGFVQTPQSFYNADLFQYNLYAENNIPNEQDYFFREVNIGRNCSNSAIYAGSNTLIAREALDEVGGIRTGTITEDFATGIDIQAAGYVTYAIDTVLAHGLAPNDFISLIKQRQRWARGCVQVLRNKRFLGQKMPFRTKASYMASFLYWWTFTRRFIYILAPILFVVFGVVIVNCTVKQLLCIWLPFFILYNLTLKLMSGKIRNTRWSNITDTIMFPYLIVPVITEAFGVHMKKFAVTPKEAAFAKNSELKYALPHLFLGLFSVVGIILCVHDFMLYRNYGGLIILYWLCVNLYSLMLAVVCISGRINFRGEDYFAAQVPATIFTGSLPIKAETVDLSETEMTVALGHLEYLPDQKNITVELRDTKYRAQMTVKTQRVHYNQSEQRWHYSFKITGMSEENRRQYYQLVFDREHRFPQVIKSGFFKDLATALRGFLTRQAPSYRSQLVMPAHKVVLPTASGLKVELMSYNYRQLMIRNTPGLEDDLTIIWQDGLALYCQKVSGAQHKHGVLFTIRDIVYEADAA